MDIKIELRSGLEWARRLARITVGNFDDLQYLSDSDKEYAMAMRYFISEHSPIRAVDFFLQLIDIKYPVSVHYVRHVHTLHFVQTSRPDRTGNTRSLDRLIRHGMIVNAQAFIDMARKRLCVGQVAADTYAIMVEVKRLLSTHENGTIRAIGKCLVPNCVYRMGCPEFKSCGLLQNLLRLRTINYAQSISERIEGYTDFIIGGYEHGKESTEKSN